MGILDIFTGNNSGLSNARKSLTDLAGFSGNIGQQGTNAAFDYNKGILSGDPTQVAMTLSPEIKTLQDQAQQNKNTVAQFGNRGGGMNAVMAGLDDATRAKLIQLMGSLRQGAANNLQTMGTQNLQLGQSGNVDAAKIAQQEHENLMNSIFGKGIADFGATALNAAEGGLGL